MFEAFLAFMMTSVVFWGAMFVGLIVILTLTDPVKSDSHAVPAILVVLLGYMAYTRYGNPFSLETWLLVIVGYFILGSLWSVVRWYILNSEVRNTYTSIRDKIIDREKITGAFPFSEADLMLVAGTPEFKEKEHLNRELRDLVSCSLPYRAFANGDVLTRERIIEVVMPKADRMKSKVIRWIIYWPTSLIWMVINNPVYRIGNFIYQKVRGRLGRITERMFADLK